MLVSVIIPVYNAEKYLKECLDSVVNQTLEDIEIICVNDGSTDNSLAILETYQKSDNRIKIISQENSRQGFARNVGLKNSSGKYIAFIDSDDYVELNMIEELCNNAISNNSDIVVSKVARFDDNSTEINYSKPGYPFEDVFDNVDFDNFTFNYRDIKKYVLDAAFGPWMKLYNHDFLLKNECYFEENIAFEDVPFHIKAFLNAKKISFSPNFFYYYRNNPESTVNTSDNGYDIFEIINIVESYLKDNNFYDEFKDEFDLFKVRQILNYIITTASEDYFKKAKAEFSKMRISSNKLIPDHIIKRYELALKSDTYYEYIIGHYGFTSEHYNKQMSKLMNNINGLNETIDKLNHDISSLTKQNSELKKENRTLIEKNNLLSNSKSSKFTKSLKSASKLFKK